MTYYKFRNPTIVSQKGKIILSLAVIFILVLLSVFYLFQTNKLVEKNFQLRAYQGALREKQEQSQKLLVLLTQASSLNNLQEVAKNLNLVMIEKMNYLKLIPGFFALSEQP